MTFDCSFGLGYLPILWSLFTVLTLASSYTMAIVADHVYPFLPSISATGAHVPESNVFSLLMNISIILAAANYFTRYFQCQHQARHCGDNREVIYKYNQIALMMAIISLAGALVVANIQARREYYLLEVHDAGAVIFFVFTAVYFCIQTLISYKISLYALYTVWLCHLRFILTLFLSLCAGIYLVTSAVSSYTFRQKHDTAYESISHLEPGDEGYTLHVVSNASEWLSFFFIIVFSLTFFDEFQQVIMLIDCQEKSPTMISYDGIGEYDQLKNFYDEDDNNDNNN